MIFVTYWITFSVNMCAYDINQEQWDRLLYIKNQINMVTSNEFYLSRDVNVNSFDELQKTILSLKSSFGKNIACNYPARYLFLKSQLSDLPIYNLQECENLKKFVDEFQKDKISLVFTSEYIESPSSAFGHIMLIFKDENESYNTADTIHFAAVTPEEGFLKYAYKGLSGEYNGYFAREPFFKKVYQYNTKEQRYMHIYDLDYSQKEILYLIYHLYELRKAQFKYYFTNGNCASYISDFLNVIEQNNNKTNPMYYMPIDTIKQYQHTIVQKNKFIPLVNKLSILIDQMSDDERKIFFTIIETQASPENNLSDLIKEALVNHNILFFRKFRISYKNYNSIINQKYVKSTIIDRTLDPLKKNQPSYIKIGYAYTNNDNNYIFGYRPLYSNIFDIQYDILHESEFSFLDFEIKLNSESIRLESLAVLSLKSFNNRLGFYNPLSWQLYSGIHKNNLDYSLKYNNEIGLGYSKKMILDIRSTFLFNLGLDNINPYFSPSIYIYTYPSKNTKFVLESLYKQYKNDFLYMNSITSIIKKENFLYSVSYKNTNNINNHRLSFDIKYNF